MTALGRVGVAVALMGVATVLTRAFPFLFLGDRETPRWLQLVQTYVPPVVMVNLLLFSFRGTDWLHPPYGLNELISVGVVVGLHLWRENSLLSILSGTACYMALQQSGVLVQILG